MPANRPKRTERPGVDRAGRTPLHYAAGDGDVAGVKELLASGIDASATDDAGWTPLHFAAQENRLEVVRLLLQAGAAVDPRDSHGNTPLSKAVFNSCGIGDVINVLNAQSNRTVQATVAGPGRVTIAAMTPIATAAVVPVAQTDETNRAE